MTIPAAWYPDPQDASRVRWWDGDGWTATTQPDPALVGLPGVTPPPPPITAPLGAAPPAFTEKSVLPVVGQQLFGVPVENPASPNPWATQTSQNSIDGANYLPMGTMAHGRQAQSGYPPQDLQPGTRAIWLYIFLPIINVVALVVLGFVAGVVLSVNGDYTAAIQTAITQWSSILTIADGLVFVIASLVIAFSDSRTLRERGYFDAPSGWLILVPLIYMIMRAVKTGAVRYLLWWILLPGGIVGILYAVAYTFFKTQTGL